MAGILAKNTFELGQFHDYVIAGNACNAFCVGELGSYDDFFLVGVEPDVDSNFPMLTGNFLSCDGELLFKLTRNVITMNPGNCAKILGDHVGYEIHDSAGNKILGVRTVYSPGSWHPDSKLTTTLFANFYDKNKRLVFHANSGEEDERIETHTKQCFGYIKDQPPQFTFGPAAYAEQARIAFQGRGAVYQVIQGTVLGQELNLDGKMLIGANLDDCTIHVRSADFALIRPKFRNCRFVWHGDAARLRDLVLLAEELGSKSA